MLLDEEEEFVVERFEPITPTFFVLALSNSVVSDELSEYDLRNGNAHMRLSGSH